MVDQKAMPSQTAPIDDAWVDPALTPFTVLVQTLAVQLEPELDANQGMSLFIDSIGVDLPIEMDLLVDELGDVRIAAGPPTQYTETSVMPVFHRMKVHVELQSPGGEITE